MAARWLAVAISGALAAAAQAPAPGKLAIAEPALHQYEDGPTLATSYVFQPGDFVFVSARFTGFRRVGDDPPRIHLRWKAEAFDPAGVPIVESKAGEIDTALAPQDEDWMPKVRHEFPLPPLADSGEYKVVLTVEDEFGKTSATRELRFHVKGMDVAPSDTLVVRDLRFRRGEQDGPGIRPPSYRPGDPVWVRFEITGYRFAERNRFHVSYGVQVLRASGASLYSVPEAADEREETFYRKRYVLGIFSLQLTPDISTGEYTLVLQVRDHVGGQEHEERAVFTVD
jgi:hypothetical protein